MAEEPKKKVADPQAQAKNWEDRLKIESEAPHKWNENWGELFPSGVPHDYSERIKYLEAEVNKMPVGQVLPKYIVHFSYNPASADSPAVICEVCETEEVRPTHSHESLREYTHHLVVAG